MSTEQQSRDTFAHMGRSYQERVVQCLIHDPLFAEQMSDVLDPRFFEIKYLQQIVGRFYDHRKKYKTYPSVDVIEMMVTREDDDADPLVVQGAREFLRGAAAPLDADSGYIRDTSLEFCKRQTLRSALMVAIDKMENAEYDSIQTVIREALNRGGSRDLGHDYLEGFTSRGERSARKPISTGWPVIDRELNGGFERATLTTFIAPTGAGKSMFLCNVAAAGIACGYNVTYITCEMADFKIGLRVDSYFSGVEINDVPGEAAKVELAARTAAKGRLFIKEFGTKTASVQTIRSYLQRLSATKSFVPDIVVVDYADLLRSSRGFGEKRYELEAVYEELRALAQELNIVLVTADQTNRAGLDMEIVTIGQIGEAYAKATVCDVIFTISRRMEDKQTNSGRLFVAKSRLGRDGTVWPFLMNSATVRVRVLNQGEDPIAMFMENNRNLQNVMGRRFSELNRGERAGQ